MAPWTLLTDPRTFFEKRREDYSLAGPGAVVVAHAVVALAATAIILRVVGGVVTSVDAGAVVYAAGSQRVSAPREIVFAMWAVGALYFLLWLLVAGVVYLVSLYFDGDGSFRRLLAFVGWTLVPTLVPAVARAVVVAALLLDAPSFATEAALREWVATELAGNPARTAVTAVRPLFSVWMAYLWILAAEYGRDLTRRQALVSAGLPVALVVVNATSTVVMLVTRETVAL